MELNIIWLIGPKSRVQAFLGILSLIVRDWECKLLPVIIEGVP